MQIHVRSLRHELLDSQIVEVFSQTVQCGASDDGLSDALFADVGRGDAGGIGAGEGDDEGAAALRECE